MQTCKKPHKTALALHSAAEALGYQNTNLQTLELYLAEPGIRLDVEKVLELEPQEKGYEVLLIEPYYKSMLNSDGLPQKPDKQKNPSIFLRHTSTLLTFLVGWSCSGPTGRIGLSGLIGLKFALGKYLVSRGVVPLAGFLGGGPLNARRRTRTVTPLRARDFKSVEIY